MPVEGQNLVLGVARCSRTAASIPSERVDRLLCFLYKDKVRYVEFYDRTCESAMNFVRFYDNILRNETRNPHSRANSPLQDVDQGLLPVSINDRILPL